MKALLQRGFTLIELMIVVAIIGVLAVVALPLYRDYLVVTAGGAAMKGVSGFASKALICHQLGTGCEGLRGEAQDAAELTITPDPAMGVAFTMAWRNADGFCEVTAALAVTGEIEYSAASAGRGDDALCRQGAGFGS